MITILDESKKIKKIDFDEMAKKLEEMPKEYQKAWQESEKIKLPKDYQNFQQIIVCGMGASAIGGDLAKNFSKMPIFVNRDYILPKFANKKSLIVLISYSGNTEETLNCLEEAKKNKNKVFIITSNGNLLKNAQKLKLPFYKIEYSSVPRLALPYLFTPLLKILEKLNFLKNTINFEKAFSSLSSFNDKNSLKTAEKNNFAKQLSQKIHNRLPIIISSGDLKGIARRWKTQFNENAKNCSFFDTLPELKHNTIEGLIFPRQIKNNLIFLLIQSNFDNTQIKNSFPLLKEFLKKEKLSFEVVNIQENDLFSQNLSLLCLGDWLSFYLSILNQINPSPVKKIDWLKNLKQ
ncbi:MAG: glucose/mannose-6-phosphate isomerase [Parcubacteria group bacterium Athens1014_10]|nr:MAG: glucose/mannose-6-phosphate isomerase [Parcubacteria group bacterium Athens1014_10]TSD05447.1 MAG: glucose/mannose-6-phosphate isomerase [Parcubacteria group bacterium Athens0714_12]